MKLYGQFNAGCYMDTRVSKYMGEHLITRITHNPSHVKLLSSFIPSVSLSLNRNDVAETWEMTGSSVLVVTRISG